MEQQEQQPEFLACREESYRKAFKIQDIDTLETELRNQALEDGFKLVKDTGKKINSLYLKCYRSGNPREITTENKRTKLSKKIDCPFKLAYAAKGSSDLLEINLKASWLMHNHTADMTVKSKQLNEDVKKYMLSESKKKPMTTLQIKEKLEDRFQVSFNYQAIANVQKNIDIQLFGKVADDANNMKNLIIKLKEKFPNFLGEILVDQTSQQLKGVIFATPTMKKLAERYMDLLIMDTTFGTNRFRLKHWTMCGKDNNGRTVIFAEGLVAQETTEQFSWLLSKAKEYFIREPNFILIDSDPALISAVETTYPDANLKLCGWHTENNIKNHLYGLKKDLEKITDEETNKNLYELTIKLPYLRSTTELERRYEFLLQNLTGKTKEYFVKLYNKRDLWALAFNKDESLNAHCTGLVENVNRQLKEHVGVKSSLVEYLFRVINFTIKMNTLNSMSKEDQTNYNNYFPLLKDTGFVKATQEHVSEFALTHLVLNSVKSMSYTINEDLDGITVTRADNLVSYKLTEQEEQWKCVCFFSRSMKLPCEHQLKILSHFSRESEVLDYFSGRWLKIINIKALDPVQNELAKLIEEDKTSNSNNIENENNNIEVKPEQVQPELSAPRIENPSIAVSKGRKPSIKRIQGLSERLSASKPKKKTQAIKPKESQISHETEASLSESLLGQRRSARIAKRKHDEIPESLDKSDAIYPILRASKSKGKASNTERIRIVIK